MQYQIQTLPIWDAYKSADGCPLCAIFAEREKRVVGQYLSENVMDPDFRSASNNIGFCPEHMRQMFAGQNKLGLALQLETRAAALRELIKSPTDKKAAKKQAQRIETHRGCVICSALAEPMSRYYLTVAEMYAHEADFPELFKAAHHCVKHAAKLYDAAAYAGKKTAEFLDSPTSALKRDLKRIENELRGFADCFDFNNSGRKPDPTAIPRAINILVN